MEREPSPTTGYGDAVTALGAVVAQQRARSDSVRRAVTATLGWVGAQRLRDALAGDSARIGDRRVVQAAAELEEAADALDAVPNTGGKVSPVRREAWSEVVARALALRRVIEEERHQLAR